MALTQRLDLRQTQALVMTPQLQQAIKLLQLSNLELASYIEGELAENPLLERDDPAADAAPVPAPPEEKPEESEKWHEEAGSEGDGKLDLAGDPEAWRSRGAATDGGDLPGLDQTLVRPETLRDHLLAQLSVELHEPADRLIGAHLIEMVDESGYLTGEIEGVARILNCSPERIEETLKRLQHFDPPGIFARNLSECLALQLIERNRYDPAMQRLVENLPILANRDVPQLLRVCGVDA